MINFFKKPPDARRHSVAFWKGVSLVLAIVIIMLLAQ
ncbi:MAG: hypothetical protein ACI8PW_001721 [Methylophilaceae bacterium]|jgi:hypothetical protein